MYEIMFLSDVLTCSALDMEASGVRSISVNLLIRQKRIMERKVLESDRL